MLYCDPHKSATANFLWCHYTLPLYPMERLLNKTSIWLLFKSFFLCTAILWTIFASQYTSCNETEKTDCVVEVENKQELTNSHWCSVFSCFLTEFVMKNWKLKTNRILGVASDAPFLQLYSLALLMLLGASGFLSCCAAVTMIRRFHRALHF